MPEYPEDTVNVDLDSLGLDGLEAAQDSIDSDKPKKKKQDDEEDGTLNINLDDLDLE